MRCFSRAQNGILVATGGRTGGKLVATGGIATSLPPADILDIVYTLWNRTWLFLVLYWSLHNQFPWVCGLEYAQINIFVLSSTGGNWWQNWWQLVVAATSFVTTWDFANSHPISKKIYAKCRYGQTLLIYGSTIMKYDQIPITINVSKTENFRFRIADLSSKIRWMEEVEWSDPKISKKVWKSIILDRCENL